jgi:hypothetical protein
MEVLRRDFPDRASALSDLGLTGFMWGWAVNAARYSLELPLEPNPAIVVLPVGPDEED